MAVKCDAGENEIVFSYETPGLKAGKVISIIGVIILAAYCTGAAIKDKRNGG